MKTISIITQKERGRLITGFFTDYCSAVSGGDPLLLQLMLTNRPLQAWFIRQFTNGEQRFINYMVRRNTPIKLSKAKELYIRMATDHIDKFSKIIMYEINKQAKSIRNQRAKKQTLHSTVRFN